jgi:hypothetical protein
MVPVGVLDWTEDREIEVWEDVIVGDLVIVEDELIRADDELILVELDKLLLVVLFLVEDGSTDDELEVGFVEDEYL